MVRKSLGTPDIQQADLQVVAEREVVSPLELLFLAAFDPTFDVCTVELDDMPRGLLPFFDPANIARVLTIAQINCTSKLQLFGSFICLRNELV